MKLDNAYLKGRLLIHPFIIPPEHKPYFRTNKLYAGYNTQVNANQSLLNIPLVSSIITYFWMMNKPLEIDILDEEYVSNLLKLQEFFSKTYELDLSSELIVKKTVHNEPTSNDHLLFFSGGLDSTYSLFDNIKKHPGMLMICGYDMHMNKESDLKVREKWCKTYRKFAESIGEKINFSYTNTRYLLKENLVQQLSGKHFTKATTYWGYLRHGTCLTGMAAPLADRFGAMITSANGREEWDTTTKENPFGTGVNVDHMLGYAGIPNHYHGAIDRFVKALRIRDWLNSGRVTLRVCYKPLLEFNCMRCEKCLRTLSQIVLAGVNPNRCGMKPPKDAWRLLVKMFKRHEIKERRIHIHFKPMKEYILNNDPRLPKDSRVFYDWLLEANLDEYVERHRLII